MCQQSICINIYIVKDWDCLIRFVLRCLGDRRRSSGGYIVSHRDKRRLPEFRVQCRGQTMGIKHLGWQTQNFCWAKKTHYIGKVKRKYCNSTNYTALAWKSSSAEVEQAMFDCFQAWFCASFQTNWWPPFSVFHLYTVKRHFHFDVIWRWQLPLFIPMIGSFHLMSFSKRMWSSSHVTC